MVVGYWCLQWKEHMKDLGMIIFDMGQGNKLILMETYMKEAGNEIR